MKVRVKAEGILHILKGKVWTKDEEKNKQTSGLELNWGVWLGNFKQGKDIYTTPKTKTKTTAKERDKDQDQEHDIDQDNDKVPDRYQDPD